MKMPILLRCRIVIADRTKRTQRLSIEELEFREAREAPSGQPLAQWEANASVFSVTSFILEISYYTVNIVIVRIWYAIYSFTRMENKDE
mgnify:CR=1 FL=1